MRRWLAKTPTPLCIPLPLSPRLGNGMVDTNIWERWTRHAPAHHTSRPSASSSIWRSRFVYRDVRVAHSNQSKRAKKLTFKNLLIRDPQKSMSFGVLPLRDQFALLVCVIMTVTTFNSQISVVCFLCVSKSFALSPALATVIRFVEGMPVIRTHSCILIRKTIKDVWKLHFRLLEFEDQ